MERQRSQSLGGTGLRVSRIGFGLAALGPAYINLGQGRDVAGETDVSQIGV